MIVKVYGRTVGFNYLTFKINTLWKPTTRIDSVDLIKDFFLIKFNSNDDYDKVLKGGSWFVGEHFLAIKSWETYFKSIGGYHLICSNVGQTPRTLYIIL